MIEDSHNIKRYVAEHSPKSFAAIIKDRNQQLLDVLKEYKKKEYKKVSYGPDIEVSIGCPHCSKCYACEECLWTTAEMEYSDSIPVNLYSCIGVEFGGVDLHTVSCLHSQIVVDYSHDTATLRSCPDRVSDPVFTKEQEYKQVYNFLKAHIEWSKWACWGKKYHV